LKDEIEETFFYGRKKKGRQQKPAGFLPGDIEKEKSGELSFLKRATNERKATSFLFSNRRQMKEKRRVFFSQTGDK